MKARVITSWFAGLSIALLAVVSNVEAQPPAPAKIAPGQTGGSLVVGQVVGETPSMAALPVRIVGAESGVLQGRITQSGNALVRKDVALIQGGKVVSAGLTEADGSFSLKVPAAGEYVFLSGSFDQAGRKVVRVGAGAEPLMVTIGGGAPQLVGVADQPVTNPIGTKPANNEKVVFASNVFSQAGARRYAGNETAILENSTFRGIVTSPVAPGRRDPIAGAAVYLIRNGQIVSSGQTLQDGSFAIPNVTAGIYSIVAAVGGYSPAAYIPPAPVEAVGFFEGPVLEPVSAPPGVLSPYYQGAVTGVPRPLNVRLPFSSLALQAMELVDRPAAPATATAPASAEFRVEGSTDAAVNVSFSGLAEQELPVVNLSPIPYADLRPLLIGVYPDEPIGAVPIPPVEFGGAGGGFGGGGGGAGGFGGLGALAGLAAAAGIAAAASGGGGGGNTFVTPVSGFRP